MVRRLVQFARREQLLRHPIRGIRGIWLRVRWWVHWHWYPEKELLYPFYGGMTIQLAKSGASLGIVLNRGFTDRDCADLFLKYLRPGMVAVDCGAHIGEYTLIFAKMVGEEGQVHAFEPHPGMFQCLEANVKRNELRRVTLNHAAVSDKNGVGLFLLFPDPIAAHLVSSNQQPYPTVEVPIISLDEYVSQHGLARVDAIKIDVEGSELALIRGAAKLLQERPPGLVFIECDDHQNEKPITDQLRAYGYEVVRPARYGAHPHLIARWPG
jgi:FkbM family methyltransferase